MKINKLYKVLNISQRVDRQNRSRKKKIASLSLELQ